MDYHQQDNVARCQLEICRQRDFLPLKCKLCNGLFCSNHWKTLDHECKFQFPEKKAIVCDICKAAQNTSDTTKHVCVPKVQLTCSCCKVKLTLVTQYQCKLCSKYVCLKHRMSDQHDCKVVKESCCNIM
ncbi:hypothetical protein pb186bvf_015433 [Paramecium bursaria]